MKLGVITGIKSEADCLFSNSDGSDILIRCAGARPEQAEQHASDLISSGCTALVSFGIAGGLSPDVLNGQIVVSDKVILPNGEEIGTSEVWRNRLVDVLGADGSVVIGKTMGSETIVSEPTSKRAIHQQFGAIAVDMESHRVAIVAAKANVPFLVIRAISDTFDQGIPRSAQDAIDKDGTPLYLKVMAAVLKRPHDIPKLMRLSKDTDLALASLRRVALITAPLFCLT